MNSAEDTYLTDLPDNIQLNIYYMEKNKTFSTNQLSIFK